MGNKMRSYKLAERVMKYTKGEGNYLSILAKSREYCKNNTPHFFSHVGDDYAARVIASDVLGKRLY